EAHPSAGPRQVRISVSTTPGAFRRPGLQDFADAHFACDTGLSCPTVIHYLEIVGATLTVHLVRPHHPGKVREWTHQPEAYAFDAGSICHARGWNQLRPDDYGGLWEHLVYRRVPGGLSHDFPT
ncbi:MAG: hypothetical protein KIT22_14140, partial [Verrucomicrobiae bacterium]|nr:hypothetical protein [Verrucomicrobiae bacterium]